MTDNLEWYWRKRNATEIENWVDHQVTHEAMHDADARMIQEGIVEEVVLNGLTTEIDFTTAV